MNKTELVKQVAQTAGLTVADAKKAVDAFVDVVKEAVAKDEKVQLIGFGTFGLKKREARQGVNPQSGQKITIAAKNVVKFTPGAEFSDKVNA